MKRIAAGLLSLTCLLAGCQQAQPPKAETTFPEGTVEIILADDEITVGGAAAGTDSAAAVYLAKDIIYYEEGRDFTYGEGEAGDAHSVAEAESHTVVHITQPGTYAISGKLSAGQIAVDLGEDAEEDPAAVVTLILNGVDITCTVAPAVIFYNVYECGSTDAETADKTVDTTAAGANVVIADGTVNNIVGSYVARIYKPESVELSEDGSEVLDAKKLHKYDAAFYSRQSMNISGGAAGSGVLNIEAENEGLDSELHLTVNGGTINIRSGNDGINTNEDGVSVTTINGGNVNIQVTGETGEGDGIDSNGWLVINGGSVVAAACDNSADSGIDSDMGIHINGGSVMASGHMLDRIEEGGVNYAVFTFGDKQPGGSSYTLKDAEGTEVGTYAPANAFSILLVAGEELAAGDYSLWSGETRLAHGGAALGGFGGAGGFAPPEGMERPDEMKRPEDMEFPEGMEPPEGMDFPDERKRPENMEWPEGVTRNEDGTVTLPDGTVIDPAQRPADGFGGRGGMGGDRMPSGGSAERSSTFTMTDGANYFSAVGAE